MDDRSVKRQAVILMLLCVIGMTPGCAILSRERSPTSIREAVDAPREVRDVVIAEYGRVVEIFRRAGFDPKLVRVDVYLVPAHGMIDGDWWYRTEDGHAVRGISSDNNIGLPYGRGDKAAISLGPLQHELAHVIARQFGIRGHDPRLDAVYGWRGARLVSGY